MTTIKIDGITYESRAVYLQSFTVRQLRRHARQNGVYILQRWTKPQLIAAILMAAA